MAGLTSYTRSDRDQDAVERVARGQIGRTRVFPYSVAFTVAVHASAASRQRCLRSSWRGLVQRALCGARWGTLSQGGALESIRRRVNARAGGCG